MRNSNCRFPVIASSGEVVYFNDNPLFRAFWHNGSLLFANAVFMVGQ